jgi:glutathione S-transferase
MPQFFAETAAVRPLLMPVVQFPDGEYRTDSTPIIHDLERLHPQQRSIVPADPACAFLSDLIEDMADEWLTKCLFNYRFSTVLDQTSGAEWVMDDAHPSMTSADLAPLVEAFIERQVTRMPLVGCTPHNAPLLEAFYLSILEILEPFVATDCFLFGSRPALADFGLYGQLRTLATDPTPMALMRQHAPRTDVWVRRLDDASGVDGAWYPGLDELPPAVTALVALAGRFYLPFLEANARAIDGGASTVEVELDGHAYTQPVYRYQAKCRDFLVRSYAALPDDARVRLMPLLQETECLRYLDPI